MYICAYTHPAASMLQNVFWTRSSWLNLDSQNYQTGNAPSRRKTHPPDGKRTGPTENAPSRRKTHRSDGKRTAPTENAPSKLQLIKSTCFFISQLSKLSDL